MVCESDTGCICNMEIYTAERKKFWETVLLVLGPCLGIGHHTYQDSYYNAASTTELVLQSKTTVCGTVMESRGLTQKLKMKTSRIKIGNILSRKGDIFLQTGKYKWVVQIISMIHDTSVLTTGKNKIIWENIVKTTCIKEYSAYMKGTDQVDQFLLCCSILRKMMTWTKKVMLHPMNCGLFNSLNCTISSIHRQKWHINSFCQRTASIRISLTRVGTWD